MKVYENKEACLADLGRWANWERTRTFRHPKPAPLEDTMPQLPPELNRMVLEASGHKEEHDRLWTQWFDERLGSVGNTISIYAQMFNQCWDWEGKSGVLQYGRKELKAMLQAEINRLQSLVDEL